MQIDVVNGESVRQISPGAVSFFPFGVYIQRSQEQDELLPWANVQKISSNDREVWQLLNEAGVIPDWREIGTSVLSTCSRSSRSASASRSLSRR